MDSLWNHCLRHFEKSLPAQQYKTWIQPLHAHLDQHTVVVSAPNRFVLEWVKDKFVSEIERLSSDFLRKPTHVVLTLSENAAEETTLPVPEAEAPAPKPKIREQSRLSPSFTFDSFVTGKANQLARAAALQVSEHPGVAYNPLFVYGGVGLGKTHLIQAIGNLLLELSPSAKVRYIHAERYVSDVVRAYQHKAFDGFKKYYHSLDLLLIDDIQFFSGKNRTQEEFFYAFNALIEAHKQVIITCDTYPKEIAGNDDLLVRFDQRVEGVEKFLLGAILAAKKLDIVDQQKVERVVVLLETVKGLVLIGANHVGNVALGVNIADLGGRAEFEQQVTDGLDEVGLAQADPTVDKQRVVRHARMFGDLQRGGARQLIGLAGYEGVESKGRVEATLLPDFWFRRRRFRFRFWHRSGRFFGGVFRKSQYYMSRFAQEIRRQPFYFGDEFVLDPLENKAIRRRNHYRVLVQVRVQRLNPGLVLLRRERFFKMA